MCNNATDIPSMDRIFQPNCFRRCICVFGRRAIERRSWQSRNRFLLNGREHMLTVPVRKADRSTCIEQILVDSDQRWRKNHLDVLRASYSNAKYGPLVIELIEEVLSGPNEYLSRINIDLIARFSNLIDLSTRFLTASDMRCGGSRTRHLEAICDFAGCCTYLSPQGSRAYLEQIGSGYAMETQLSLSSKSSSRLPTHSQKRKNS